MRLLVAPFCFAGRWTANFCDGSCAELLTWEGTAAVVAFGSGTPLCGLGSGAEGRLFFRGNDSELRVSSELSYIDE